VLSLSVKLLASSTATTLLPVALSISSNNFLPKDNPSLNKFLINFDLGIDRAYIFNNRLEIEHYTSSFVKILVIGELHHLYPSSHY
jgi:hypothetical protein